MYTSCEGLLIFTHDAAFNDALKVLIAGKFVTQKNGQYVWQSEAGEATEERVDKNGSLTINIPGTLYYRFEPTLDEVIELALCGTVTVMDDESVSLSVWKNGHRRSLDCADEVEAYLRKVPNGFSGKDESLVKDALTMDSEDFEAAHKEESQTQIVWDSLETAADYLVSQLN